MPVPLLVSGLVLLLALLGGAPQPEDFAPPGYVEVELVSVRRAPSSGHEIRGYLGLWAVVPDTPERPVEVLAGFGSFAYLPAAGLDAIPMGLVPDGRWHRPELYPTGLLRFAGHRDEWWWTTLQVFPLRHDVGRYRMGQAPVDVSLFIEGRGWTAAQRVWVDAFGAPGGQVVRFDSPVGLVEVYVRAGLDSRLMEERRGPWVPERGWPVYLCRTGTPPGAFEECWFTGYDP